MNLVPLSFKKDVSLTWKQNILLKPLRLREKTQVVVHVDVQLTIIISSSR